MEKQKLLMRVGLKKGSYSVELINSGPRHHLSSALSAGFCHHIAPKTFL